MSRQKTALKQENSKITAIRRLIESNCADKGITGWNSLRYLLEISGGPLLVELRDFAAEDKTQEILELDLKNKNPDLRREAQLAGQAIDRSLGSVQLVKLFSGSLKLANPENGMPL